MGAPHRARILRISASHCACDCGGWRSTVPAEWQIRHCEVAIVEPAARPLSARGERAGECLVLSVEAFERLGESDPVLQTALMRNLLASFYEVIGRMTREVGTFFQGR